MPDDNDRNFGLTRPIGAGDAFAAFAILGAIAVVVYALDPLRGSFSQSFAGDRALLQWFSAACAGFAIALSIPANVLWRQPRLLVWFVRVVLLASMGVFAIAAALYLHTEAGRG